MKEKIYPREKYLSKIRPFYDSDIVKVITGIRRCGKSYLLEEIYKNSLLNNGVNEENIIVIDLDDEENYDYYDPINLFGYVIEAGPLSE